MLSVLKRYFDNSYKRGVFVRSALENVPAGSSILDAGCGSQQYRKYCVHLNYKSQDFCQYKTDSTKCLVGNLGGVEGYNYGQVDYVGNIWDIDERDRSFDAILCTEVLEHIPYPNETLHEFSRLLKPGGCLILTVPSNSLRHMDPFFFYTGFTNRYLEEFLCLNGFTIESIETIGDYYRWLLVELLRSVKNNPFSILFLAPAICWFALKRKTATSINTLCFGYHVVARKA